MMFAVFDVFASYSSDVQVSLARVQDLTLIFARYKFTELKVTGITEDILLHISNPKPKYNCVIQKGHKIKRDYFYLLIHSGGTSVSSRIRINSSFTKALSGPSYK